LLIRRPIGVRMSGAF